MRRLGWSSALAVLLVCGLGADTSSGGGSGGGSGGTLSPQVAIAGQITMARIAFADMLPPPTLRPSTSAGAPSAAGAANATATTAGDAARGTSILGVGLPLLVMLVVGGVAAYVARRRTGRS